MILIALVIQLKTFICSLRRLRVCADVCLRLQNNAILPQARLLVCVQIFLLKIQILTQCQHKHIKFDRMELM